MKAMLIKEGRLVAGQVPYPVPAADEVVIQVKAAGINRADLLQKAGLYPPPAGAPEWPGLEVAGLVVALGDAVARAGRWQIGDKVCALLAGGGYAEAVAVHQSLLLPVPQGFSFIQAAALPEAFATAYLNLFIEGQAQPGESLLMHAGSSGLASILIPWAKSYGLRVITSLRKKEKAALVEQLGVDHIIYGSSDQTAAALKEQAELGFPVDLVIDCLGGAGMGESLPYLARGARWIMIATLAGDITKLDLRTLYVRGIRLIGSTLRNRPLATKAKIMAGLEQEAWPLLAKGEIVPLIHAVLPLDQAEKAQAILTDSDHVGKVILEV